MAKYNNTSFGVQGIEAYLKDEEYFLKVTFTSLEDNGDVFKFTTDGIKLGISPGDKVALINEIGRIKSAEDFFINSIYVHPAHRIPCQIRFGWDNVFNLSRDTTTTGECIKRHVKRCTIEELEKELGCRLEIVGKDGK